MAKLRHVAVYVEDLDWALEFFPAVFEMEIVGQRGNSEEGGVVQFSDGTVNVTAVKMVSDDPYFSKSTGLNHVGFDLDDSEMDKAVAIAEGLGAVVQPLPDYVEAEYKRKGFSRAVKMSTPDGFVFEFHHGYKGTS